MVFVIIISSATLLWLLFGVYFKINLIADIHLNLNTPHFYKISFFANQAQL